MTCFVGDKQFTRFTLLQNRGGQDNVSVIIVDFGYTYSLVPLSFPSIILATMSLRRYSYENETYCLFITVVV